MRKWGRTLHFGLSYFIPGHNFPAKKGVISEQKRKFGPLISASTDGICSWTVPLMPSAGQELLLPLCDTWHHWLPALPLMLQEGSVTSNVCSWTGDVSQSFSADSVWRLTLWCRHMSHHCRRTQFTFSVCACVCVGGRGRASGGVRRREGNIPYECKWGSSIYICLLWQSM